MNAATGRTPVLTFFNNKGGAGKTSLVYHLAWMFAELGKKVVCIDLDPQANLTASFFDEETIDAIWNPTDDGIQSQADSGRTIYKCVEPLTGVGDIQKPELRRITENLHILPGDVALSGFEGILSEVWPKSMDDNNLYRPLRILSSFWQVMQMAARQVQAELILVDIGPNLGAINRSALIATDSVVIPLGADLYSLQGLKNLGPTLRGWKKLWKKRRDNWKENSEHSQYPDFRLPSGDMTIIGYLCQQHGVRLDRPVKAYDQWVNRIPVTYRQHVLEESVEKNLIPENDPYCLATIKHYRSLAPMAQECRKPIFDLTSADGAIGSHANAVCNARKDFKALAEKIAAKVGLA